MKGAFPSTPRPRFPSLPVADCYRSMTCRTSCRCAAPFTAVTYEPSRSRYSRKIGQRLPSELTPHPPGRAPPLTHRSPRPQLALNQQLFIRHGSYLLVERSKMIAYRNFFRKVSPTHPPDTKTCRRTRTSSRVCPRPAFQVYELHTVPTTKLDLRRFKGCLAAASVPMEIDEIECILANLVYTGCALMCSTRAPITHSSPTRIKPRMRSLMTAHAVGTSRDISRISTPSSSLPRATPSRPCATCSVSRDADDAGPS